MRRRSHCVIAYDVSDDNRRTKLAKLLLDYGDRMQDSVFEADLEPAEIEKILRRVERFLEPSDRFCIYRLCADCAKDVRRLGPGGPVGLDDLCII